MSECIQAQRYDYSVSFFMVPTFKMSNNKYFYTDALYTVLLGSSQLSLLPYHFLAVTVLCLSAGHELSRMYLLPRVGNMQHIADITQTE